MEYYDIFISYKRDDKERVFAIKDYIEKSVGVKCWIDLNGIESDAQFVNIIMNAIDKSTVFLFMYSHTHSIIEDYETDWTVREINYAQSLKKRIVFINIDGSPLTKYFIFMFPQKQQVDATSESAKEKLCKDLKKWLNIKEPEVQPNEGSRYKVINDTPPQPVTIKNNIHAQDEKETTIVLPNEPSEFVKDDKNNSGNITTHTLKNNRRWIVGVAGLLFLVLLLYVFGGKQSDNNELSNNLIAADSLDNSPSDSNPYSKEYNLIPISVNESIVRDSIKEHVHKTQIPHNFVLVPSGRLKHLFYKYDDNCNSIYKDWDVDSFYICKYEVTQTEYEKVMGMNPSKYKGDQIPIHNISNFDAIQYCQKRSVEEGYDGFYIISNNSIKFNISGNGYRLPTDHEWAFAARNGDKPTTYAAGDSLAIIAWYGRNSGNKPHKIAQKKPNGRGLYDMNGNVSELSHTSKNEIWSKGGSYEEWPYDGHVFHEDDARGYAGGKFTNKKKDPTAGIRLVFMPRGFGVPKDLNRYFSLD